LCAWGCPFLGEAMGDVRRLTPYARLKMFRDVGIVGRVVESASAIHLP
jgi:hypothetical protein